MSVAIIWHTCEGPHRTYRHKAALCLTILQSQDATLSICTFEIHLRSGTKYDLNFLGIHTVNFFKLPTIIGHEDSYIFMEENGAIATLSFKVTTTCSEICLLSSTRTRRIWEIPAVALAQTLTNGSNNVSRHMSHKSNLSYLLEKFLLVLHGMEMKHWVTCMKSTSEIRESARLTEQLCGAVINAMGIV